MLCVRASVSRVALAVRVYCCLCMRASRVCSHPCVIGQRNIVSENMGLSSFKNDTSYMSHLLNSYTIPVALCCVPLLI